MDEKLLRGISGGQGGFSLNQPNRIWPERGLGEQTPPGDGTDEDLGQILRVGDELL